MEAKLELELEILTVTYRKPDKNCKITDLGDGYKRIQIPLIRKIYPQLLMDRIVTVERL